jgi:cell division protein FtsB
MGHNTTQIFTDDQAAECTPMSGPAKAGLYRRRREQVWIGRALCFAGCVLAANALIGERGLSETLRARREFRQAVADLSRLQYQNATLLDEVQRLRQDAHTIEGVARAELGLIKPGEILVVIKSVTP